MRHEVEKRLHRVMVKPSASVTIQCIHASKCSKVQNCERCNHFFLKCSDFKKFIS